VVEPESLKNRVAEEIRAMGRRLEAVLGKDL
jgi:hypothetical protein